MNPISDYNLLVEPHGKIFYHTFQFKKGNTRESFQVEVTTYDEAVIAKLLIIEDDPFNIAFIKEALKAECFETVYMTSGKKGIKRFKRDFDFDLVLLDIRLPDMSGYEVLRQIRKLDEDIPVIAQTAYARVEDKAKCLKSGCSDYIAKPIHEKKLVEILNRNLNLD